MADVKKKLYGHRGNSTKSVLIALSISLAGFVPLHSPMQRDSRM
jgi:hypothetical protein